MCSRDRSKANEDGQCRAVFRAESKMVCHRYCPLTSKKRREYPPNSGCQALIYINQAATAGVSQYFSLFINISLKASLFLVVAARLA